MRHAQDEVELAAAQEILRRAVRLDRAGTGEAGLSRDALEAAAGELGVQPASVAMALAEAAAGVTAQHRALERLIGPRTVASVRVCAVSAEEATGLAAGWLERGHLLRVTVGGRGVVVGRRRHDPAARAGRAVRSLHGSGALGKVQEVRAAVGCVADGTTAVCVRADVSDRRAGAVLTGTLFGGLGAVAVGLGAAAAGPLVLLAAPLAVVTGVAVARHSHRDTVRRVTVAVDAAADAVASGAAPPSALSGLTRTVRRIGTRAG